MPHPGQPILGCFVDGTGLTPPRLAGHCILVVSGPPPFHTEYTATDGEMLHGSKLLVTSLDRHISFLEVGRARESMFLPKPFPMLPITLLLYLLACGKRQRDGAQSENRPEDFPYEVRQFVQLRPNAPGVWRGDNTPHVGSKGSTPAPFQQTEPRPWIALKIPENADKIRDHALLFQASSAGQFLMVH